MHVNGHIFNQNQTLYGKATYALALDRLYNVQIIPSFKKSVLEKVIYIYFIYIF